MNLDLPHRSRYKLVLSYCTIKKPYAWGAPVIYILRSILNSCNPWLSWDIKQVSQPSSISDLTFHNSGRLASSRLWAGFPRPALAHTPPRNAEWWKTCDVPRTGCRSLLFCVCVCFLLSGKLPLPWTLFGSGRECLSKTLLFLLVTTFSENCFHTCFNNAKVTLFS